MASTRTRLTYKLLLQLQCLIAIHADLLLQRGGSGQGASVFDPACCRAEQQYCKLSAEGHRPKLTGCSDVVSIGQRCLTAAFKRLTAGTWHANGEPRTQNIGISDVRVGSYHSCTSDTTSLSNCRQIFVWSQKVYA